MHDALCTQYLLKCYRFVFTAIIRVKQVYSSMMFIGSNKLLELSNDFTLSIYDIYMTCLSFVNHLVSVLALNIGYALL